MKDDKIVKLLEEIRDLHKENVTRYNEHLKRIDERYEAYLAKVRKLITVFLVAALVLLIIFLLNS